MSEQSWALELAERGWVPDWILRRAIRRLCRERLRELGDGASAASREEFWLDALSRGPISTASHEANSQHYEVAPEFFQAVLGPRRKYSCCYWTDDCTTLADAEEAALAITCDRAGIVDGQQVLDLGCGWGALSLWMAEHYPNCRITAVSNSATQRQSIEARVKAAGIMNLRVVTADINEFTPTAAGEFAAAFDRVVSVEMFEHLRNYDLLLNRIASWLRPAGRLFVHIFCHRRHTYAFETDGASNWMGRHFFTGGIMPAANLLTRFQRHLKVVEQWSWNGRHYRRTAEAWLRNIDQNRAAALQGLGTEQDRREARRRYSRWRMFFLAVAELFGFDGGEEWFVSHYLLVPAH